MSKKTSNELTNQPCGYAVTFGVYTCSNCQHKYFCAKSPKKQSEGENQKVKPLKIYIAIRKKHNITRRKTNNEPNTT